MSYEDIDRLRKAGQETIKFLEEEAAQRDQELYVDSLTWGFISSDPGFELYADVAGSFQPMIDRLGIHPFIPDTGGDYRLFLAQYKVSTGKDATLKINFIGGFQTYVILMLTMIGEYSTRKDDVVVADGADKKAAPVLKPHFYWPEQDQNRILLTKTGIRRKGEDGIRSQFFNKEDITGDPKHWWFLVEYAMDQVENMRFPVPGEFTGLAIKLYPGYPWGGPQKSLPFIYSGNWIDTVYYTSAKVKEVIEPSDTKPYPTYRVTWRKFEAIAKPSDFAEYQVDDRVTILKDVATDKEEQTWEDEDTNVMLDENLFDPDLWVIVPITFYDDGNGQGI